MGSVMIHAYTWIEGHAWPCLVIESRLESTVWLFATLGESATMHSESLYQYLDAKMKEILAKMAEYE